MTYNHLEEKAQEAKHGKTPEERIDALLQAFELFCQETSRLEVAYKELKDEFGKVNIELDKTNHQLESKVEELNRLSGYLGSILSHISQGLMYIKFDGTITTFNEAFEAILGKSKKEVEGKRYDALFPDKFFGFSMKEALISKIAYPFTRVTIGKEKERFYEVECSLNGADGLIVLMRDVTRLKVLELIANRNDRMQELGEMAAQVAHEIRNPLGGIKGFASLLKRDLKDLPEQAKMADYIIEGTDHLNRLVTQVLNYSRPVMPHFELIDLNELVHDAQNFIKLDCNIEPQPRIILKLPESPVTVQADFALLKGALLNLLVNSCQAMPKGGTITITTKKTPNEAVLEVADTGIGIPKEIQEKVFSPFFTTKANGNGFGLAEVHKVVRAHGGTIKLVSDEKVGTVFTVIIPMQGL